MERIERGWAGHFCLGYRCKWHRNTLVKNDDGRMIVVSSVGALPSVINRGDTEEYEDIGLNRWYETMCFIAKVDGVYIEMDVNKEISLTELKWAIDRKPDETTDLEAEKMHEDTVDYVMKNFDECYEIGESYYKEWHSTSGGDA